MAHGLAAQLGGALTIQSKEGVGTNVELWLPVSGAPLPDVRPRAEPADAPTRKGLALLVDDEEVVRTSTAEMMIELGYEVKEAETAEAALAMVERGVQPDLLVTDHLMPGMSGIELVRALRTRCPELPALIVSGYAEAEGVAPDLPRLTKPFRRSELAAALAELT